MKNSSMEGLERVTKGGDPGPRPLRENGASLRELVFVLAKSATNIERSSAQPCIVFLRSPRSPRTLPDSSFQGHQNSLRGAKNS